MTDAPSFPHLAAPGAIGPLALRNRMLLCPMGDNLAEPDGTISERQLAYYEARSAGGAALLMVGSAAIAYPDGATAAEQTALSHDDQLPGLRALTERVHAHGAAIAAQLVHNGPNAVLDIARGRPLLVPSIPPRLRMDQLSGMVTPDELTAMTEPFTRPGAGISYQVATEEDLAELVDRYAEAAARAEAAGFDGVEVHAGHGYVIDAFLSPLTNQRTDRWGGSVEGRARLLIEVLRAVRRRVGSGFAVWIRLNAREVGKDGGETLADALEVAALAEAAGAQAIHVTAYADPGRATGITAAHTPAVPGARVADAAAVKAAVGVPVITFGRLEPAAAEAVLAAGSADFVAFGRKLIAGPDLPEAVLAGRPEAARPCAYQYRCIGNIFLHRPLACAVSPDTADEVALRPGAARPAQHVLVVGGGPVGLEVAHRLAANGHRATLWEAADQLGGLLVLAGEVDPALAPLCAWLAAEAERAGVAVELGRTATVDAIAALGPDRVVLATGAAWAPPDPPDATVPVLTPDDLLAGPGELGALPDGTVVVGSGKVAASLAAAAARVGSGTTLLAPEAVIAPELGLPGRFRLVHDLGEAGVDVCPGTAVEAFSGAAVRLADGSERPATTILWAVERVPRTALAEGLRAAGLDVEVLGDATGAYGLEAGLAAAARFAARVGRAAEPAGVAG
ncbi:FAD-dependent oxidoreductase [Aquihabitans sp. G128]|uniref:oxidoreductase n=1 Tax=Aquihabitans sp. G128 TaxID=2849779 RepID=UPI001C2103E7|nr:FAD-dependent oxidoreductase [Aquihabitans sp. G128]QXC62943.1 FAD-dependent oxidoreductase [Aquihabitans sp. G128]